MQQGPPISDVPPLPPNAPAVHEFPQQDVAPQDGMLPVTERNGLPTPGAPSVPLNQPPLPNMSYATDPTLGPNSQPQQASDPLGPIPGGPINDQPLPQSLAPAPQYESSYQKPMNFGPAGFMSRPLVMKIVKGASMFTSFLGVILMLVLLIQ